MVTEFGMSTLGPRHIAPEEFQMGPLAGDVHAATSALLDEAIGAARALLASHRDVLAALADLLLAEETVEVSALRRLLDQRGQEPGRTVAVIGPTAPPAREPATSRPATRRPPQGRRPS